MFKNNLKSTFPTELSICTSNHQHLHFSMSKSSKLGGFPGPRTEARPRPATRARRRRSLLTAVCSWETGYQACRWQPAGHFKFGNILTLPFLSFNWNSIFWNHPNFCFSYVQVAAARRRQQSNMRDMHATSCLGSRQDLNTMKYEGMDKNWWFQIKYWKTVFCIARLFFLWPLDRARNAQRSWEAGCVAVFLSRKTRPRDTW